MNKLTEKEIFSAYIGAAIDPQNFNKVAYRYGDKYLICNADYINDCLLCEIFGITDTLKEKWGYSGIGFTISVFLDENTVSNGHLDKYRESSGGHGRPTTHVLTPTQQELRVARRILQYITK